MAKNNFPGFRVLGFWVSQTPKNPEKPMKTGK
jgi:hypothetical protein